MRLLLDQNIGHDLKRSLLAVGADTVRAADVGLATAPDDQILAYAAKDDRIVVTNDRDFGGLVVLQRAGRGVVLIRPAASGVLVPDAVAAAILRLENERPPFIAVVGLHQNVVRTRVRGPA